MNVAYYMLAFDNATDTFYNGIGVGADYKDGGHFSTFTLEAHITYDREVMQNDPLRITTHLLDFDAKRIHYFHQMYHAEEGYLASTNELISIHIDMRVRRSAPMPAELLDRLAAVREAHALLPKPPQAGRVIGIRRAR
jgi:acyl-CoA thioester hydrolase